MPYELGDLYPDVVPCLEAVRALGLRVGIVGNQTAALEQWARDAALPSDVISSSATFGVRKPDPAFFVRIVELAGCAPTELAYVGDRVDNDVLPAAAAGLLACMSGAGHGDVCSGRRRRHLSPSTISPRSPRR